ncbi:putative HIRA-interacting protein 5 [Trypanosoma grayi]|uniref:putative HIRA-interacting protein 5 n=1 Tax=Trypanosoma grayi TaxID=71804 RepID=UPI0004F47767|nr:putative HIRA-interacting protein 5 [Trypanosoma grayi]KEG11230.1 putative HIRA-interacting protein 5 [Trypanosoma grayi]
MLRPGLRSLCGVRPALRQFSTRRALLPSFHAIRRHGCLSHRQLQQHYSGGGSCSSLFVSRRFVLVETNETPNPDCLRFYSMELSFLKPGMSMDFPNAGHAYKSPLVEILFGIEGVEGVYLADEYVTVRKGSLAEWDEIEPLVKESILEFAESKMNILSEEGEELVEGQNNDTEPEDDDDEVVLAVKELLATRIRPMLRADGGNVRYLDMDDGTVFVMLEGACKSCPSSGVTLKNGIERMLMHWIPEVVEVQECTEETAQDILDEKTLRRMKKEGATIAAK